MTSGVKVPDVVGLKFKDMKLHKQWSYMILRLNKAETEVEVEKYGQKGCVYEEFLKEIECLYSEDKCRYVICDFKDNPVEKMHDGSLILFLWSPDAAKVHDKMIYAATYAVVKGALGNGFKDITARHDMSDMDIDEIASSVKTSKK